MTEQRRERQAERAREIWSAPRGRLLEVDEDRVLLKLTEVLPRVRRRAEWAAPLSILVTVGVVFPFADFGFTGRRLGLRGGEWSDVIHGLFWATAAWLLVAVILVAAHRPMTPQQVLDVIMQEERPVRSSDAGAVEDASAGATAAPRVDPSMAAGERVMHPAHGAGTLTELTSDMVTVVFDNSGPRTLLREFTTLRRER